MRTRREPKVVATRRVLGPALARIEERCRAMVWEQDDTMPRDLLLEWIKDCEGLYCVGDRIDQKLLSQAPSLRIVSHVAAGCDNIDLEACTHRGIPVGNTPTDVVDPTADLTMALLLAAERRVAQGWDMVRRGSWKSNSPLFAPGVELAGKTLGIIGMGRIGLAVAERAAAFGMRILYHNRTKKGGINERKTTYAEFDQLLGESDAISLHVPLTGETRGLISTSQLEIMKPSAILINTSRGAVVDTVALVHALENGGIAFAALDVTDPEPVWGDHPLVRLENVLVTPHIGTGTLEARSRMASTAMQNLFLGLEGKRLRFCVNSEVYARGKR